MVIKALQAVPDSEQRLRHGERLLAEEGPGILGWAVRGLQAARRDLQSTARLALTETQTRRVMVTLRQADALDTMTDFVRRFVFPADGGFVPTGAAFWAPSCTQFVSSSMSPDKA